MRVPIVVLATCFLSAACDTNRPTGGGSSATRPATSAPVVQPTKRVSDAAGSDDAATHPSVTAVAWHTEPGFVK
jgi:hypothetical protein